MTFPADRNGLMAFSVGGGATAPTVYTALSQLPAAASLATGTEAKVITATTQMNFTVNGAASGSRAWRCIGGASDDLVNQRVNFTSAGLWVLLNGTWDERFPWFKFSWGSPLSTGGWEVDNWQTLDAARIQALSPATAGTRHTAATRFELVQFYQIQSTVAEDRARYLYVGRTATNGILVASPNLSEDLYPVRIRGAAS